MKTAANNNGAAAELKLHQAEYIMPVKNVYMVMHRLGCILPKMEVNTIIH